MRIDDFTAKPGLQQHQRHSEPSDDKICLFLDNLSANTSDRAKDAMREHGFRWIFNVPYSPEYNPIELVFS